MKMDVVDFKGSVVGDVDLAPSVFSVEPNYYVISNLIRWQRANSHDGTRSVKTRSTVHGTGRKNFRQKGTGSARRGSLTVSQFRGGGIVFGPLPVERSMRMNKRERALALRGILSVKLKEGSLRILNIGESGAPSTKMSLGFLDSIGFSSALFVGSADNGFDFLRLSCRNVKSCRVLPDFALNGVDLLGHHALVLTVDALKNITERLAV